MASTWIYGILFCSGVCLLLPVVTGQTESSDNTTTVQQPDPTSTTPKTTTTTSTTTTSVPPTLPLLPQTEGQNDYYVYKQEDNKLLPCSRTTFVGYVVTEYENDQGELVTRELVLPDDVTSEGECGEKKSTLSLHWGGEDHRVHFLNFTFVTKPPAEGEGTKFSTWVLQSVSLTCNLSSEEFEQPASGGMQSISTASGSSFFEIPLGLSYECESEQSIDLAPEDNTTTNALKTGTFTFSGLKVQPFQLKDSGVFAEAVECDVDSGSTDESTGGSGHKAAIAIASILCIAVVGSLVTYYCVKRSQKTRYTSME